MFSLPVAQWLAAWWMSARNRNHNHGFDDGFDDSTGGPPPRARIEFTNRSNRSSLPRPNLDSGVRPTLQSQSTFNILPLEVRLQVWRDAVGGHAFHLVIHGHDRRFVGWMCGSPDPRTCRMDRYGGRCRPWPLSEAETKEGRNMLALLRACRQIYSETVDLLYSENSFTVFDSDVIYYLPFILLPEYVNSIRSLRFIWDRLTTPPLGPRPESPVHQQVKDAEHQARWTKIWHIIAGMQNLRELEVMLRITHPAWVDLDAETATVLFQSIKQVKLPANFLLILPYLAMSRRRDSTTHSGSVADGRKAIDLWRALPCEIRIVESIY